MADADVQRLEAVSHAVNGPVMFINGLHSLRIRCQSLVTVWSQEEKFVDHVTNF